MSNLDLGGHTEEGQPMAEVLSFAEENTIEVTWGSPVWAGGVKLNGCRVDAIRLTHTAGVGLVRGSEDPAPGAELVEVEAVLSDQCRPCLGECNGYPTWAVRLQSGEWFPVRDISLVNKGGWEMLGFTVEIEPPFVTLIELRREGAEPWT